MPYSNALHSITHTIEDFRYVRTVVHNAPYQMKTFRESLKLLRDRT
ncbi:MAG: hypothetical protein RMY36_013260 [Nostoc sp. SerVER01]|nr:hypothetical protein [Nostoc sp. SerVER01]